MKKAITIYLIIFTLLNLLGLTVFNSQPDFHGLVVRTLPFTKVSDRLIRDTENNLHLKQSDNSLAMRKTAYAVVATYSMMPSDVKLIAAPMLSKNLPGTTFRTDNYDTNESIDLLIKIMKDYQFNVLDYREYLDDEADIKNLFYKNSSLPLTKTCFWEFQQFVSYYKTEFGVDLDPEGYYTNPANYIIQTYTNAYLGEFTEEIGRYYHGVDDYTVIYPNFETSYQIDNGETRVGDFVSVLMNLEKLNDPKTMVDSYMFPIGNPSVIVNHTTKNNERIYIITDNSTSPYIAFLTTLFKEVHLVDVNNIPKNSADYIKTHNIDNVLLALTNQVAYFDDIVK